jgi:cytochrome oxidase Cu insertion factor (SCO1/SenC/PrrC family)
MDKVTTYRAHVQAIITEYSQYKPAYGDIEREVVFDTVHDRYQLMSVGWQTYHRIHSTVLHVDIRNGKIWIQYDGTEEGIANRLVELGVPHEDIVLAFHPPYKRPYTNFAVG